MTATTYITSGCCYSDAVMDGAYYCNGWMESNAGTGYADTGPLSNIGFIPQGGPGLDPKLLTGRHTNAANYLFFDGHVKWMNGTSVSPGKNAATPTSPQTTVTGTVGNAAGTQGAFSNGVQVTATYSIV